MAKHIPKRKPPTGIPKPPPHLEAPEHNLWIELQMAFDLRETHHQSILKVAMSAAARMRKYNLALEEHGPYIEGAQGQLVINPAASAVTAAEGNFLSALTKLRLHVDSTERPRGGQPGVSTAGRTGATKGKLLKLADKSGSAPWEQ